MAGPVYPGLAPALPSEYLLRLLLANDFFGDDIRLCGIGRSEGVLIILTSQPTVVGDSVGAETITEFMEQPQLMRLDGVKLGHESALSFYRDLDQLAVFDAHPGNVLRDSKNRILPIDLIIVKADGELADQLEGAIAD